MLKYFLKCALFISYRYSNFGLGLEVNSSKFASKWEILLVLIVVSTGLIITSFAALKAKDDYKLTENRIINRNNELHAKSSKYFTTPSSTTKTELLEAIELSDESQINEKLRNSKLRNAEQRYRPTTVSAILFTDFIDNKEATDASNHDYENRIISAPPSETTTPIHMNSDKIETTFHNPGIKKAEEVVIEHHHHLSYYPKTKTKSFEEQTNKLDERKVRLRTPKDDYLSKAKKDSKLKSDLERNPGLKVKELKNAEEPANQFESLESENKSSEKEVNLEQKLPRSSIIIDGLPGFPDPDLYLNRASTDKNEFDKLSNRNKTNKLEMDNRNAELAADGAGFVADAVGYRANNDNDILNRESSNREVSSLKEGDVKEKSSEKNVKESKFVVKNPEVIWATDSDESAEEQEVNSKLTTPNRSLPPIIYKHNSNVFKNLRNTQSNAYKSLPRSLPSNVQHQQHLTNSRLSSPSIKFVETAVAESTQLNNKIPLIVSMHNHNLGKLPASILKTSSFNNLNPQLLKSNFALSSDRQYNPSFRLQKRRKREVANKNLAGKDKKVYRIFSFNQEPINLTKNRSADLETSSNVNVERNKPLKTSNYNYNNMNLYSPPNYKSNEKASNEDVSSDGKLGVEKLKEDKVVNSNENDYNADNRLTNMNPNGNINLKKSKPKKKLNNSRQPMRQPNFIEDNPFLNLFNTLTNIGQTSLSQALGQPNNLGASNLGSNNLNSRALNEDDEEGGGDDGNNINSNNVSTEKPKYGILGSGNFEIVNGGIYKDMKSKNKSNQPQQAFSTSDYSKDNSKEQLNNRQNKSNLNNFQPFSFNDIPLLGFQGFDNFSKASKVNKSVIKKY